MGNLKTVAISQKVVAEIVGKVKKAKAGWKLCVDAKGSPRMDTLCMICKKNGIDRRPPKFSRPAVDTDGTFIPGNDALMYCPCGNHPVTHFAPNNGQQVNYD